MGLYKLSLLQLSVEKTTKKSCFGVFSHKLKAILSEKNFV